jgi:hypothetical protein
LDISRYIPAKRQIHRFKEMDGQATQIFVKPITSQGLKKCLAGITPENQAAS